MSLVVETKLGRGPAGASYIVRDAQGARFAAKVLRQAFAEHPPLVERIRQEVDSWTGFRHDHVLTNLGWGVVQGRQAVIQDLTTAPSCRKILEERGRMDVREAMRIVRDVALALATAHQEGLAAGDLRPEKVFFDPAQGARLADLGLSVASCMAAGYGQFGMCFGHPSYLAPEVLQAGLQQASAATDVYALGILFYELVTGRLPYGGDPAQQIVAHLDQPLPIPSGVGITPEVAKWLLRMTAKQPLKRFADGASATNGLYRVIGQAPPFPEAEKNSGDTSSWRAMADDSSERDEGWSEEKVSEAKPVKSADVGRVSRLSERLKRIDLTAEAEEAKKRELANQPDPGVPQVRVGQSIGRGPAGATYEGALRGFDGSIVIKSLTRRFNKHPELLARVQERIAQAREVKGSRVLPLVEELQAQGRHLLIYEKASGPCARAFFKQRGPLAVPKALGYLRNLGEALVSAEEVGQVHGDLRPDKFYLDAKGISLQLTDFGLCEASCLANNFGSLGMHFGNPTYLAPEVIQDAKEAPDAPTDMYALGIVLYEMIAGKLPYIAKSPKGMLLKHLKHTLPPPSNVSVPGPVAELILRLTAKIPARRPQSAAELLAAIEICQKQVLLTTGLGKSVAVDEFNPSDSGEEAKSSLSAWEAEAAAQAGVDADWSKDKLKDVTPVGPAMNDLMVSEELSPDQNPFADL